MRSIIADTTAQGGVIQLFIGMMIAIILALTVTGPLIDQLMNNTSFRSSVDVLPPISTPIPTSVIIPPPSPVQNVGEPIKTTNLNIHAEKTDVVVGEDILIKMSAVNLITKKTMHIQIILTPPSGVSVSSSDFVFSGAGQYTSNYRIEPGQGRDIEIRMIPNQVGNFNIEGRAVYYFGDDIINSEDYRLSVPIIVRSNGVQTESEIISTPNPSQIPVTMLETAKPMVALISLFLALSVIMIFIRSMLWDDNY